MAEDLTNRLYAIGDAETGILFVTLDPLRVSYISKDDIAGYATYTGETTDVVFSDITHAVRLLFKNVPTAKADFCFAADLPPGTWQANRIPFPPLFDALDFLAGRPNVMHPLPAGCTDASPNGLHQGWLVQENDEYQCRKY